MGRGLRGRRTQATITPSPNTGGPPDLRITAFDRNGFTVTNSGTGPPGPFLVSAEYRGSIAFPGLAAGASIAQPLPQACSGGATYTATADAANQVAESNEGNNALRFGPVFC